jgi:hypothetical protein
VDSGAGRRVAAVLEEAGKWTWSDPMQKEMQLTELVERLKEAAGQNLSAVVLYGSGADHEFHEKHSDLNVLCLLEQIGGAELKNLQPVSRWWWRKGHPPPLVFTLVELKHSSDVFAIELLDMKRHHRMLLGADFFTSLDVPMTLHRLQVKRELRISVIRLREAYLRSRDRRTELVELMIASASSFAALFRHCLIALGREAPDSRRGAVGRSGALLGIDSGAFLQVLDIREGKRNFEALDSGHTFAGYLDVLTRVAEEIDRRFAALQ